MGSNRSSLIRNFLKKPVVKVSMFIWLIVILVVSSWVIIYIREPATVKFLIRNQSTVVNPVHMRVTIDGVDLVNKDFYFNPDWHIHESFERLYFKGYHNLTISSTTANFVIKLNFTLTSEGYYGLMNHHVNENGSYFRYYFQTKPLQII